MITSLFGGEANCPSHVVATSRWRNILVAKCPWGETSTIGGKTG